MKLVEAAVHGRANFNITEMYETKSQLYFLLRIEVRKIMLLFIGFYICKNVEKLIFVLAENKMMRAIPDREMICTRVHEWLGCLHLVCKYLINCKIVW
jgi:hypothetical protein